MNALIVIGWLLCGGMAIRVWVNEFGDLELMILLMAVLFGPIALFIWGIGNGPVIYRRKKP